MLQYKSGIVYGGIFFSKFYKDHGGRFDAGIKPGDCNFDLKKK